MLGLVHDLDRAGVAHIGKQRAHAEVGLADGRLHVLDRGLVLRLDQRSDGGVGFYVHVRARCILALDVAQLALAGSLVDHPFGTIPLQRQLHHAQGLAPGAGHHGGHTVDGARLVVHAGQVEAGGGCGVGEHAVLVAHHHGINARHLGQVQARVLHGG